MRKIKVIENSALPKLLGVGGITIYPLILLAQKASPEIVAHEMVHISQVERVGWLSFYTSYCLEFLALLIQHKDWYRAYRNISYEKEAYDNERH
jgi:hypothetical protein